MSRRYSYSTSSSYSSRSSYDTDDYEDDDDDEDDEASFESSSSSSSNSALSTSVERKEDEPVVYEDFMPDQEPDSKREKRADSSASSTASNAGTVGNKRVHLSNSEEIAAIVSLALKSLGKKKKDKSVAAEATAGDDAAPELEAVREPTPEPPVVAPAPLPAKRRAASKAKAARQELQQKKNLARRLTNLGKRLEAALKEHRDLNRDLAELTG